MGWKQVEEMTGPEVVSTAESLASYAASCRVHGQGINSKEVIRFNKCIDRIEAERLTNPEHLVELHTTWNPALYENRDMLLSLFRVGGTMAGMKALFA
jgi:hypothetical protein